MCIHLIKCTYLCIITVACDCQDAGIAARVFGNIADLLGSMAYGRGGMRSGPGGNKMWNTAFQKLEVQ